MTIRVHCLVGLLATMLSMPALATLVNGNFDSGVGWNDASGTGTTSIAGGEAKLSTGAGGSGPFSAVLVQGDDGGFNFANPISLGVDIAFLSFKLRFQDDGVDVENGPASSDYLGVSVYDKLDFNLDLLFTQGIDFLQSDTLVKLDVSSLAGRDVALSFELHDGNDNRDTSVFLDDVVFAAQAIPEPSQWLLYSFGLLVLTRVKRKSENVIPCT